MHRRRIPKPGTLVHDSEAAFFDSIPESGAHAIRIGTEWLDLSYIDNGFECTLVCFHSALTNRVRTVPAFSGRGIAEKVGTNLISVADPALAKGDIDLAWFLGTRGMGILRNRLSPVIKHLLGNRRAVLFGASGGGYAATLFGQDFPGHTVVAVNPRLFLRSRPVAAVDRYLAVAHGVTSLTPAKRVRAMFVVDSLAELYAAGLPFDMFLLQNRGDSVFLHHHAEPFVEALAGDPHLHYVQDNYGAGHVSIPTDLLVKRLQEAIWRDSRFGPQTDER